MHNVSKSKVFLPVMWIAITALVFMPIPAMADVLGEYSFLHVTFNSVWHLFLFIFVLVMIPFVLLIVTSWRFRHIKEDEDSMQSISKPEAPGKQEE